MALFGSKETSVSKTITPIVVRTQNVAKEIAGTAKSNDIKADTLDFRILDIQTYRRFADEKEDTEWELIDDHELYELDDETTHLNGRFQIKQTYEIEIFSIDSKEDIPCKNLKLGVGANATKCKIYLSIGEGSIVEFNPNLEEELKDIINKKKIRAGILIHVFDEMLEDVVSKISAQARVDEHLEYKKAETILIAEGFEPTKTINDEVIMHYEKSTEVEENEKMDYSSRDFIKDVKEDDLLIEYIKPKMGAPGRNCRGEYIEPTEPVVSNEVSFLIDETIKEVDDEDSVKYIANENGYVVFENNTYSIQTDMDVGEISFKTTGSINSGVDSDVSISVKEADAEKDAIGSGMKVEVTEINIDGNVGSNAEVVAITATIAGQTHSSSMVKADKLDINVHKGKAYGKDIKITRLEHGEVDGDIVHITQASGGIIRAKEVEIEICVSHVNVTASNFIEIKSLKGSENSFTIDPLLKKSDQKGLDDNQKNIDDLEEEIKDLDRGMQKYEKMIKGGMASFLDVKKRLISYKKNGVKLPASFVKKYKEFSQMQEELKGLSQEHEIKKDQLKLLTTKTVSFQDDILGARIINRDHWIGYNEIKFKLVEPPMELIYKPEQGSSDKIFGLIEVEEGVFEIQALDE